MAVDEDSKPRNICPNCFEPVEDGAEECETCGFDLTGPARIEPESS